MTPRISLIPGKTRGHRPRLQMLLHEFCDTLDTEGWLRHQEKDGKHPARFALALRERRRRSVGFDDVFHAFLRRSSFLDM